MTEHCTPEISVPKIKHYTAEDWEEMANNGNWVVGVPYDPDYEEFAKNYVSDYDENEFDLDTEQKRLAARIEDLYIREAAKKSGKYKIAFAGLYK